MSLHKGLWTASYKTGVGNDEELQKLQSKP